MSLLCKEQDRESNEFPSWRRPGAAIGDRSQWQRHYPPDLRHYHALTPPQPQNLMSTSLTEKKDEWHGSTPRWRIFTQECYLRIHKHKSETKRNCHHHIHDVIVAIFNYEVKFLISFCFVLVKWNPMTNCQAQGRGQGKLFVNSWYYSFNSGSLRFGVKSSIIPLPLSPWRGVILRQKVSNKINPIVQTKMKSKYHTFSINFYLALRKLFDWEPVLSSIIPSNGNASFVVFWSLFGNIAKLNSPL